MSSLRNPDTGTCLIERIRYPAHNIADRNSYNVSVSCAGIDPCKGYLQMVF